MSAPDDIGGYEGENADTADLDSIIYSSEKTLQERADHLVTMLIKQAIHDKASDILLEERKDGYRLKMALNGNWYELAPPGADFSTVMARSLESRFGIIDISTRREHSGLIGAFYGLLGKNNSTEVITQLKDISPGEFVSIEDDAQKVKLGLTRFQTSEGKNNYHLRLLRLDEVTDLIPAKEVTSHEKLLANIEKINSLATQAPGLIILAGLPNSQLQRTAYHITNNFFAYGGTRPVHIAVVGQTFAPDSATQLTINHAHQAYRSNLDTLISTNPSFVYFDNVRDPYSASVAINLAASTRVMVSVSSIDAYAGINYLLSMGADRQMLVDSLKGIISQAYARGIHHACESKSAAPAEFADSGFNDEIAYGQGCEGCLYTGMSGGYVFMDVVSSDNISPIKRDIRDGKKPARQGQNLFDAIKEQVQGGIVQVTELIPYSILKNE